MYNQIDANKRQTNILIAIFFALIVLIGYAVALYSGSDPFATIGIAAFVSIGMALFSYYGGDKVALSVSKAQEIKKTDNPYLYNMVENLCITGGLPLPRVHVIDDPAINAFATGRDPQHASIAVTRGALERLENEELEGVIAHELAHIKNYDIRLMTVVIVLVGSIALIADMMRFSSFKSSSDDNRAGGVLAIVGIALIILSPIIAELIKLAISRRREFLADASGALLTRYPEGLARALEKIRDQNQPLSVANHATAHLFLDNPFRKPGVKASSWLSTHPPIDERIAALRKI